MAKREKTVFVDMDNTLMDFNRRALSGVPAEVREAYFVPGEFYIARTFPPEWQEVIESSYNDDPDFFASLKPLPGALDAWEAMLDHGYQPQILSSPLKSNPNCVEGKLKSLWEHFVPRFGEKVVESAIIDPEKWKYNGLALIDDRPGADKGHAAPWEQILFGPQRPDNAVEYEHRLPSWENPESLLIPMLGEIARIQAERIESSDSRAAKTR